MSDNEGIVNPEQFDDSAPSTNPFDDVSIFDDDPVETAKNNIPEIANNTGEILSEKSNEIVENVTQVINELPIDEEVSEVASENISKMNEVIQENVADVGNMINEPPQSIDEFKEKIDNSYDNIKNNAIESSNEIKNVAIDKTSDFMEKKIKDESIQETLNNINPIAGALAASAVSSAVAAAQEYKSPEDAEVVTEEMIKAIEPSNDSGILNKKQYVDQQLNYVNIRNKVIEEFEQWHGQLLAYYEQQREPFLIRMEVLKERVQYGEIALYEATNLVEVFLDIEKYKAKRLNNMSLFKSKYKETNGKITLPTSALCDPSILSLAMLSNNLYNGSYDVDTLVEEMDLCIKQINSLRKMHIKQVKQHFNAILSCLNDVKSAETQVMNVMLEFRNGVIYYQTNAEFVREPNPLDLGFPSFFTAFTNSKRPNILSLEKLYKDKVNNFILMNNKFFENSNNLLDEINKEEIDRSLSLYGLITDISNRLSIYQTNLQSASLNNLQSIKNALASSYTVQSTSSHRVAVDFQAAYSTTPHRIGDQIVLVTKQNQSLVNTPTRTTPQAANVVAYRTVVLPAEEVTEIADYSVAKLCPFIEIKTQAPPKPIEFVGVPGPFPDSKTVVFSSKVLRLTTVLKNWKEVQLVLTIDNMLYCMYFDKIDPNDTENNIHQQIAIINSTSPNKYDVNQYVQDNPPQYNFNLLCDLNKATDWVASTYDMHASLLTKPSHKKDTDFEREFSILVNPSGIFSGRWSMVFKCGTVEDAQNWVKIINQHSKPTL